MSNILREIFDQQQARAKEPALPERLQAQAPEQAEGLCSVLQFGMKHMPDGTFAVYPTGIQESTTDGTTTLYVSMPKGYSAATFEPRRITAPPTPVSYTHLTLPTICSV